MTAVSDQCHKVVLADPGWDRIAVTYFPVQTGFSLPDHRRDTRVAIDDQAADLVHVAGLEPGLFDVFSVLVRDDPIELFAVAKGVLDQVQVLANPDVDAFLFHKLGCQRVAPQVIALEESPEASISRGLGLVIEAEN